MPTIADTQQSYVQLEAAEVFHLIVAAIDHAQKEDSPRTIFFRERGEEFGVAVTIKPTSDAIATYSDYLTTLLRGHLAMTGPDARNPEQDLWYRVLAARLGVDPPEANLVPRDEQ